MGAVLIRASYRPVRNGQPSVDRALQRSEHLVPCGGSGQARIQVAGEGARLPVDALYVELVPRHLHLALVHLVHAELLQQLRGREKAQKRM